jgi:hypothetical protein
MLEILKEQYNLTYANWPEIAKPKKVAHYPIGTLRDLADFIIMCPEGKVVEIDANALTASNVSTISLRLKSLNYKLHCVKNGNKKILWSEKDE